MIKFFIDFDGTITNQDVGDALFLTFGGIRCSSYIDDYRNGKLSAMECFKLECGACGSVGMEALDTFLDSQEIDGSFREFIDFCRQSGFSCHILSDGMDYYIDRILKRNDLESVPFLANHLDLVPLDGTGERMLAPDFPYTDENCDRCACCKRNHMLTLSGDDDIIVYVGEGYSDRCPVRYADVVFAKDELLNYCRTENISYFEYSSFSDITGRLKSMQKNARKNFGFHKRNQAELARRDVYIGG